MPGHGLDKGVAIDGELVRQPGEIVGACQIAGALEFSEVPCTGMNGAQPVFADKFRVANQPGGDGGLGLCLWVQGFDL